MAPSQETVSGSNYNRARKIPHWKMPEQTRMVELHGKYLSIVYRDKEKNQALA